MFQDTKGSHFHDEGIRRIKGNIMLHVQRLGKSDSSEMISSLICFSNLIFDLPWK